KCRIEKIFSIALICCVNRNYIYAEYETAFYNFIFLCNNYSSLKFYLDLLVRINLWITSRIDFVFHVVAYSICANFIDSIDSNLVGGINLCFCCGNTLMDIQNCLKQENDA